MMGRGHVLLTPKTCDCGGQTGHCPVCDWGLGVCAICGGGEIDLEEDCLGMKETPKSEPEPGRFGTSPWSGL